MLSNRPLTTVCAAAIAAVLTVLWLWSSAPGKPSDPQAAAANVEARGAALADAMAVDARVADAGLVRTPVAWLTLETVSSEVGQPCGAARLAGWTPAGVTAVDFVAVAEGGRIVVPSAPLLDDQRICVVAEGFAPCDVTELVAQGGRHRCMMVPAARLDLLLEDVRQVAVAVPLRLERAGDQPGGGAQVVWPTTAAASSLHFDLAPGTYRLAIEDDSILVWSGGDPVVVDDLAPQRRTLALAGLVVCALWSTTTAIRTFSVDTYPPELLAIHGVRVGDLRQRLQTALDPAIFLRFAATRSLPHRRVPHDVSVRLGSGDGTSSLHTVAYQPLHELLPQEVRLGTTPDAGRLKVTVVGPGGVALPGVEVHVTGASRRPVAVFTSGDDWRPMAPGSYMLEPHLPKGVLSSGRAVEAVVTPGSSTETVIVLDRDLVSAQLQIEAEGGAPALGASVRIQRPDGADVFSSSRPGRMRVWVPPARLRVEVYVTTASGDLETAVDVDFTTPGPHEIRVPTR